MNLRHIFRGGIIVAFCSVAAHETNIAAPQAQQASADTKAVTAQALASTGSTSEAPAATPQRVTKYTLPPDRYQKAHNLAKIHFRLALISFVYGLVVLWLVLHWKISAKYRTLAESTSSRRILQALVYSPLIILTINAFELPTGIYQNWVSRQYGLSVQSWGSWFWDWTKGELVSVIIGTILIALPNTLKNSRTGLPQ